MSNSFIDELLNETVSKGASDLHLSSKRVPMVRLHGEMHQLEKGSLSSAELEKHLQQIMTPFSQENFHSDNDADFSYLNDKKHRFRVNVFRDYKGIGAVFRYIPTELPDFDVIKLEEGAKGLCHLNKGLVLVTGPTGSGKSTTLASIINWVNRNREDHIVTIEDPIEFVYPNARCLIHQRELNTHTPSFKSALRAVLRQDPDVILIGELRDLETTRLAIEAAETGHLVFGTLHTNTAYSTISRIVNQFGEEEQELIRTMLADNLKGVVCQTLLQKPDGKGRVAAREIMLHTVAGANLIRENKFHQIQSVIDSNIEMGMISMNASLSKLVSEKVVSPDQAIAKTSDKKDLAGRLTRFGIEVKDV